MESLDPQAKPSPLASVSSIAAFAQSQSEVGGSQNMDVTGSSTRPAGYLEPSSGPINLIADTPSPPKQSQQIVEGINSSSGPAGYLQPSSDAMNLIANTQHTTIPTQTVSSNSGPPSTALTSPPTNSDSKHNQAKAPPTQDRSPTATGTGPSDNDIPPPKPHADDAKYTKAQLKEIYRILRATTPEGVLGIEKKGFTKEDVHSAYKAKSLFVHSDKTGFTDAAEAFHILKYARDFLYEDQFERYREHKRKYGAWTMPVNDGGQPRNFSLEAASRQYNQSFAENAYGGDSDDEDEDEDEDEMEVDVTPDAPPSKAIKAFYMSATEAVRDLLGSGDIEQSKKEIRDMNLVIESQNELCSERKDAHKIQVDAFAVYRTAKDTYSANSTTANREKLDKAYESLGSCITRWGYPPIWLDYFMKRSEGKNPIRNDSGIPQPGGSTSRGARTGKNTSGSSHNGGHTNVSDLPETSQPGSSSASGGNMDLDPPNPLHHPEHGKCIGCLPKVGRDKFGNKVQLDCDFMFEDPFLVLSCHQVTHTWAQNYDFLPKDKQIDLRDAGWALAKEPSQIKEDKGKPIFRGWYSKQSSESKRGAGWAKILLKDNSIAVINRSNLRKIYGQSWADQWIDEYLASKSLRGDWHHLRENRAPHRLEYHPQQHLLPWNTIREHQSEFSGSDSGSDTAPQASRTRHDIALAPSGVRSTRARTLKSASTAIDTGRKNDEAALVPRAVYNTNVKALNRRMDNVESQLEELIHRMKRF